MTDQIYYKIQYPLKKAINMIKGIDLDNPFPGESGGIDERGVEEINEFLELWEKEGKNNLQKLIKELRKVQ